MRNSPSLLFRDVESHKKWPHSRTLFWAAGRRLKGGGNHSHGFPPGPPFRVAPLRVVGIGRLRLPRVL